MQAAPTVALVSSASPARDPLPVHAGTSALEAAGFQVLSAPNLGRAGDYLAGTPEERAADLHWAFAEPAADFVLQLRGGYGSGQVIPLLDLDLIRANPKPLVGMSDITLLHLALGRHAGLRTLWGPNCVGLPGAEGYSLDRLLRALSGEPLALRGSETLVGGRATGPLTGGTTTMLAAAVGTAYALEAEGRLVLLEDVNVAPYQVDRCLTQLIQAGALDGAAGFVVAEHTGTGVDVLRRLLGPLGLPALYGLPLGHGERMATVPLGDQLELDADAGTLVAATEPRSPAASRPAAAARRWDTRSS